MPSAATTKPVLTLAIIAYNLERFIGAAVESALKQTYSPLQVVVSDDCSKDNTYEVIRRVAAEYRGPHQIVTHQNKPNLGLAGNVNKVFELAEGELVALCGGDDVSMPERMQSTYDAWIAGEKRAFCLYSSCSVIDAQDRPMPGSPYHEHVGAGGAVVTERLKMEEFFGARKPRIIGCAAAYHRDVMTRFGPLPSDLMHEDDVLGMRGASLGMVARIERPLVRYRMHDANHFATSGMQGNSEESCLRLEAMGLRLLKSRHGMFNAYLHDLRGKGCDGLLDEEDRRKSIAMCEAQQRLFKARIDFHESGILRKCGLLVWLVRNGLSRREVKRLIPRLISMGHFCRLKSKLGRLRPSEAVK